MQEEPEIVVGIFIEQATPFFEEFLKKIETLDYPKSKMNLFIHNSQEYHAQDLDEFLGRTSNSYNTIKLIKPQDNLDEVQARNAGIDRCREFKCDYYFNVDSDAHLDNPLTIQLLIVQNRKVVAPLLVRPFKAWSNFWGALDSKGYYARSTDYMEIVEGTRQGLWNVPHATSCYLIQGIIINDDETKPSFSSE